LGEVNKLLPEQLRCQKITGHSGRRTMITSLFNAGIDASVISMTSKHRNLDQLRRYATPDPGTMMKSAIAIGKVASDSKETVCNEEELPPINDEHTSKRQKFDDKENTNFQLSSGKKVFYFQF